MDFPVTGPGHHRPLDRQPDKTFLCHLEDALWIRGNTISPWRSLMLNRSPGAHWSTFIADRSATVMQASGNRIARGVVQALESQVINTARYMGRTERSLCVASNRGHRRIYERIAAHDPDGAAEAMFTHITEAWLVRRSGSGKPTRLQR
ncbi:FCD domain-containing protein [Micromonospora sp. DT46]|uniref:FCD domain-containing protein n=1 Tax=Micromonospora sp. DT46 TaxID=3393435 RepID=UPI003CE8AEC4